VQDIGSLIEDDEPAVSVNQVVLKLADDPAEGVPTSEAPDEEGAGEADSSSIPDQEDREDDDDDAELDGLPIVKKVASVEERGAYEQDVRESLTGPINLLDLRVSMVPKSNELDETLAFFESLLKENYGE
jgi:hypothetical protein